MVSAVPGEMLRRRLLSDRFRARPHVVWARHADTTVLLDADAGRYYTLNEVAGRVWDLLVAGEPLLEILRCLGDEYDAPAELLEADVEALIERLLEAALIDRVPT
ncbi:MAG TPA: PqqD family protein [Gemmatimonadales bacterium]|nr:PqqD family protein [Gemmatimonadales bacterium]